MISVSEKTCSRCHEMKAASEFGTDKRKSTGLKSSCRACVQAVAPSRTTWTAEQRERDKAQRRVLRSRSKDQKRHVLDYRQIERTAAREREHAYRLAKRAPRGMKWCPKCKNNKPFGQFMSHKSKPDGMSAWCKDCVRPAAVETQHMRKAKMRGLPFERVSLARLISRDHARCQICGKGRGMGKWSVDHILPVSLGGANTYANTRLAHLTCNIGRSNRGAAQLRMLG